MTEMNPWKVSHAVNCLNFNHNMKMPVSKRWGKSGELINCFFLMPGLCVGKFWKLV